MRDYVSFEWSASRQSADPALAGVSLMTLSFRSMLSVVQILASSLSMFENDLHAR
jgi:hypothetical protein